VKAPYRRDKVRKESKGQREKMGCIIPCVTVKGRRVIFYFLIYILYIYIYTHPEPVTQL